MKAETISERHTSFEEGKSLDQELNLDAERVLKASSKQLIIGKEPEPENIRFDQPKSNVSKKKKKGKAKVEPPSPLVIFNSQRSNKKKEEEKKNSSARQKILADVKPNKI